MASLLGNSKQVTDRIGRSGLGSTQCPGWSPGIEVVAMTGI
ncbi:MAG: hypothetical protein AAGI45_25045 [Cyanobacteria bacterium P01_H01_bin.26]